MANMSTVDIEKLNAASRKLTQIDRDIFSCVKKVSDILAELDRGWASEVKDSFMQTWQTDAEALCEMIDQYGEIHELLFQAAKDFERTEREMLAQVRQLR